MRVLIWLLVGVLFLGMVSALSIPEITGPEFVDLSLENLVFNLTQITEINWTPVDIHHVLYEDNNSLMSDPMQIFNHSDVNVGNHSYKYCVEDVNITLCSDEIKVEVINGTQSVINSVSYSYAIPKVDLDVQGVVEVKVEDPRSLSINVSFMASDDDYYGENYEKINYMVCSQISFDNDVHVFNCTYEVNTMMQPGFYDVEVVVDNNYFETSKTFSERINIYNLLSVEITEPEIDFSDVYDDWIDAEEPILIRSTGNIPVSDVGIEVRRIECDNYIYYVDDIMISKNDNRGAAEVYTDFTWFDLKFDRGETGELYVFINSINKTDAENCEFTWDLKTKYMGD